jgi:hypothetical protein
MKVSSILSLIVFLNVYSFGQITIDSSTCEFGSPNGWMLVNGSETNKWQIGGAESYYDPFSRIGAYLYRLQPSAFFVSKKMILIK